MQTTSSHLNPPGILQAQAYEAKENVNYNNIQPSNAMMQSSTACRPSTAPSFGSDSPFIEHTRRDSRGLSVTKRYLKGSLLGKGGFAKCFKITDADTKVDWACKVVQKSSLTKQRHKVKLQTEIKIHKSLGHKHVVRFEDVFEDKEHVYIIMELCTNQTLLEFVKRKKRLTESETRRYMLQMLEGVRYLHHSKVIHRDLKLGNLFLGRGDEIKIGDFGLACKLQFDGERKRTLCGTPNYIAPEVLEGKNGHSYEVDLWSIGVVMYTCLVGKPPFETSDVKSTYKLIKSNTYSFPDRLHISQGAKALIRRILQSDPESRPSIDNVLQDPWFLGEGMALLQKIKPAAATGLSSTTSISSANVHRQPLHPIQDPQVKRGASSSSSGLDWEMPATNKYPDHFSVSSRTAAASADMPGPALERNLTITSAASHYLPDRLDSARGASSALQSVNNIMRPTSASAALSSDKALPPSLSSFGTASSYSSQDYFSSGFRAAASSSTSAHANNINKPCKTDRPLSAISSNAVNTTPTKRLSKQLETLDLQRDTALESCVARGAESKGEGEGAGMASTTGAGRVGDGEDQLALQSMHKNIRAVLAHAPQPSTATATKKDPPTSYLPLPSVWVSRWVDYSKKYGLGYKLSNGCSGVFFNDATKMLLETDGDSLEYIERMRRDDATKYDVRRPQSLKDHPPDLTKKVTLMEHFKNYLDETHPSRHAGDSPLDQMAPLSTASEEAGVGGVYVRKWMRTRHSIIFRLSNNNFQVNFFDDTEVLLWGDKPWVTYRGKNKMRNTYNLADVSTVQELLKRLKYTKDILSQLITSQ